MENSNVQNILAVLIVIKLDFKCKKTSQKIGALTRLPTYLKNSEKKIIFNSIIK